MTSEQVIDVSSTIGNLIRVALAVEVKEAENLCAEIRVVPLDILLLDPRQAPETKSDHITNCQLLEAFAQFRRQLEFIRGSVATSRSGASSSSSPHG